MDISKIILVGFLTYYCGYILRLIVIKNVRDDIQKNNNQLNKMRKVACKTLEEQKKFLDAKFPKKKKNKEKYFYKKIWSVIKTMVFYIPFGLTFYYILRNYITFVIPLWFVIAVIMIFPMLINLVLRKFGVEKDDISIYLRGKWFKNKSKNEGLKK